MIPPGRCAMPTAAGLHARQGRSGVARGLFPAGVAPCATIPPVARTSGNDIAAGSCCAAPAGFSIRATVAGPSSPSLRVVSFKACLSFNTYICIKLV